MDQAPLDWRNRLSRAFPGTEWNDAVVAHGAFHSVAVSARQGLTARLLSGTRHKARAVLEHRTVEACASLRLSVQVPYPLSRTPVSTRLHSAYLIEYLPGETRRDSVWSSAVGHALLDLLEELRDVTPPPGLRAPLAWAGGTAWPALVDGMTHHWDREQRAAARSAVADAEALTHAGPDVLVHGDFGIHNVLWDHDRPLALIDWDNACVASQVLDIAPLVGHFGVDRLARYLPREELVDAARYRASLPLQVAAAAEIVGDEDLRERALATFLVKFRDGTLEDPFA